LIHKRDGTGIITLIVLVGLTGAFIVVRRKRKKIN